jgi:hypothetical protein
MKVRRIVTGYNAAGKAVVKTDEQLTAVPRVGARIKGCEIWSTHRDPVRAGAGCAGLLRPRPSQKSRSLTGHNFSLWR